MSILTRLPLPILACLALAGCGGMPPYTLAPIGSYPKVTGLYQRDIPCSVDRYDDGAKAPPHVDLAVVAVTCGRGIHGGYNCTEALNAVACQVGGDIVHTTHERYEGVRATQWATIAITSARLDQQRAQYAVDVGAPSDPSVSAPRRGSSDDGAR